jgi:hypothetical protein
MHGRDRLLCVAAAGAGGETLPTKPQLSRCSFPAERPIIQDVSQPQPFRLPPVEDRLNDVRREAGQRQEPADVGVGLAFLRSQVHGEGEPLGAGASAGERRGASLP